MNWTEDAAESPEKNRKKRKGKTIELETQSTASFNGDSEQLPQNQLIGTSHERNFEVNKFSSKSKTLTFEFRNQVLEMLFWNLHVKLYPKILIVRLVNRNLIIVVF